MLALWLEQRFSKDELLEVYLNRVYLGAGTYGVDAAARLYFGVSARRLSPGQAAVLAGLPKAPSRINPRVNQGAALARGLEVLNAMTETGALSATQALQAAEAIRFTPRHRAMPAGLPIGYRMGWRGAPRAARIWCCAPHLTTLCKARPRRGLMPFWPGRARGPGCIRARWWRWMPPPARCAPWPG